MRRLPTSDWSFVGWHYKAVHRVSNLHNRFLPVRARGVENTPRSGGFIYAGSHASWWDPIVLQMSIGRPVNWLAKKELMDASRFNKWFFFDRGGCIPVDRHARGNVDAFSAAAQAIADDRVIGIFPEGTRNPTPTLLPGKTGVARLALLTGAPVVPAAILTHEFWPRGRRLPRFGNPIYLNVGEPMRFEGDASDATLARKITDDVMARIATLSAEARAARDADERWARP